MGKMKQQGGFTLIELVVVIVILGILAAVAFPRYISLTTDARKSAIAGLAGGLRSAVSVVQARYMATGNTASTEVLMVGQSAGSGVVVTAGTGIPTAAGILTAMQSTDGFTSSTSGTAVTFDFSPAVTDCKVVYDSGVVTVTNSGC